MRVGARRKCLRAPARVMAQLKRKNSAAFYDVDGTLIRINIVHAFAFYAMRQASLWDSFRVTAQTAASVPLFWAADKVSRKWFNELFYHYYEGFSEDRLVILSEELFEEVILPNIYPRARDLIAESRRAGVRQVLISGALDFTMRPLARYLGADELIANKMQFVGGKATGKVIPPIIEGANKANAIRDYCVREGLSLAHCHGYSDSASDYAMLAIVGRPTAVNPDMRLRSLARAYNWPILDLK